MPGVITINVSALSSYVVKNPTISTDCADIFSFTIYATNSDNIDITLTGNSVNSYYISNGVTTFFSGSTSVSFDTTLELYFAVENSGNPGFFDSVNVEIDNTTAVDTYTTTVTRTNDSLKCGSSGSGSGSDYIYGVLPPQLFNPSGAEVTAGTMTCNLTHTTNIVFVSINGQVLDDSEYSLVGSTLTVTPDNGFYDTDDEVLVFQGATELTGVGFKLPYREITTNDSILLTDYQLEITIGGVTATLPTAVGNTGTMFKIKNTSGSDVYLDGAGSETIDGSLTVTIPHNTNIDIVSNGTNWIIV